MINILNKQEILKLLKTSLENYISQLENNSIYFSESKAEIQAFVKVLNDEELNIKFRNLNLDKAKKILAEFDTLI